MIVLAVIAFIGLGAATRLPAKQAQPT
jgi:hypothetical protein